MSDAAVAKRVTVRGDAPTAAASVDLRRVGCTHCVPSGTGQPAVTCIESWVRPPLPPMAAKTVTHLPVGPGWSFEPKYDGFRALGFAGPGGVVLQSRQLRNLTPAFPDVAAAVGRLGEVVVDGELVVWRAGRFDFAALQDRLRSGRGRVRGLVAAEPAAFVVFDLLARNGKDLRERPYWKRRRKLEKLLGGQLPDGLVLTPATTDPAVAYSWMLAHIGTGLEGVVAKRLDQTYRPGVRGWQKLRTRITAEAIVGGVTGPVMRRRS